MLTLSAAPTALLLLPVRASIRKNADTLLLTRRLTPPPRKKASVSRVPTSIVNGLPPEAKAASIESSSRY